ncbi:hypothetical protein N656DRAFT_580025 [Canariomyces notabilis]|uniref:Uncharacterized protein n=1 Tax=Canariomyces notabilis TaxID=2074819 RepID=A0AAN6TGW4_9PEZI|nr:hypothetical protein N656DRAFT_580025 [Canariomyces arenarius]
MASSGTPQRRPLGSIFLSNYDYKGNTRAASRTPDTLPALRPRAEARTQPPARLALENSKDISNPGKRSPPVVINRGPFPGIPAITASHRIEKKQRLEEPQPKLGGQAIHLQSQTSPPVNPPSSTTASTYDKDIIDAIKYRPVTAGDKARATLEKIKAKQAKQATLQQPTIVGYLTTSALETDEALFRKIASKLSEQKTTQIVPNIPSGSKQRESNGYHLGDISHQQPKLPAVPAPAPPPGTHQVNLPKSRNIFQPSRNTTRQAPKKPSVPPPAPPAPVPSRKQYPSPTPLSQPKPKPRAHLPPVRPHPSTLPKPQPQPKPGFQEAKPPASVSAIEALGEDRTVFQWVVYRTKRFVPGPQTTAASSSSSTITNRAQAIRGQTKQPAVRCSSHLSLQQANAQAAARRERIQKGAVRKSWAMVSSPLSSSKEEGTGGLLYEGEVGFEGGEVQFFWVEEEVIDLESVVRLDGNGKNKKKGVRVDVGKVGIYRRWRWDVWSKVVYSKWGLMGGRGEEEEGWWYLKGTGKGKKKGKKGKKKGKKGKKKGKKGKKKGKKGKKKGVRMKIQKRRRRTSRMKVRTRKADTKSMSKTGKKKRTGNSKLGANPAFSARRQPPPLPTTPPWTSLTRQSNFTARTRPFPKPTRPRWPRFWSWQGPRTAGSRTTTTMNTPSRRAILKHLKKQRPARAAVQWRWNLSGTRRLGTGTIGSF